MLQLAACVYISFKVLKTWLLDYYCLRGTRSLLNLGCIIMYYVIHTRKREQFSSRINVGLLTVFIVFQTQAVDTVCQVTKGWIHDRDDAT